MGLLDRLCGVQYRIVPFPDDKRIIDIGDYYGDYTRLHAATGWEPAVDLEEGLRRTIAFYREHREVYWG